MKNRNVTLPTRITEWPGLKRTTMIIEFQPPAMFRVANHQTRLPKATSSLASNACRDRASTTSLGNLFQCVTTLLSQLSTSICQETAIRAAHGVALALHNWRQPNWLWWPRHRAQMTHVLVFRQRCFLLFHASFYSLCFWKATSQPSFLLLFPLAYDKVQNFSSLPCRGCFTFLPLSLNSFQPFLSRTHSRQSLQKPGHQGKVQPVLLDAVLRWVPTNKRAHQRAQRPRACLDLVNVFYHIHFFFITLQYNIHAL